MTCRDQEDLATSVNESLETLQDMINKDAGLAYWTFMSKKMAELGKHDAGYQGMG